MLAPPNFTPLTADEYLKLEGKSSIKHEYRDGLAYAMAGVTDAHVTISLNLGSLLRNHVRRTGCRAYISDMKAHIQGLNLYYYPDVMVSCDERDRSLPLFKRYPRVIVEVLSDSTEAFDRGDKFADYRQMESLQEYVLMSQTRQRVECFRRNAEGLWVLFPFEASDRLELTSLNFVCSVAEIYEDVEFERVAD